MVRLQARVESTDVKQADWLDAIDSDALWDDQARKESSMLDSFAADSAPPI